MIGRLPSLVARLAAAACRAPLVTVLVLLGTALPAIWLATHLELRTDFKDLLPKDKRSVLELERVQRLVASAGGPSLTVAVEGEDLPSMQRFADAVAERLAALGKDVFVSIDASARREREFFQRHRYLYADLEDLEAVRDALHRRVLGEAGLDLDLDEGGEDLRTVRDRLARKAEAADRFPGGYYVGEGGKLLAIFATLATSFGDIDRITATVERVRREIAALEPRRFHPSLRFTLTGEAVTGVEEYEDFRGDLLVSSTLCISLVLLSIVLFYGRLRSLGIIGLTLLCGVAWTFGLARVLVGYLNSSTAFLGSIVAGNGVNFGIVLLARYFEERRRGLLPERAIEVAVASTASATAGAALAAGIAYGSLSLTSFRGFNQFGLIGGSGMVLCWIATYLLIPPLAVLFDRPRFMRARSDRPWRDIYSAPFALLVARIPRAFVIGAVALAVVSSILGLRYLLDQPFEYYFGNLKNKDRASKSDAVLLDQRVTANVRTEGTDGMAIIAERPEQVPLARRELERRKREADERCKQRPEPDRPGKGCSPIGGIATIDDLLPGQQEQKLALLAEIRRLVDRALPLLDEEEARIAREHRPSDTLAALAVEDLPPKLLQPFRERDGRVGRILYVSHAKWVSVWHGEHLIAFSQAVEDIPLPGGEHVYGSGRAVIFADMVRSIAADGKGAVAASLLGVVLLVLVLFGLGRSTAAVLATLLGGVALLFGYLAVRDLKLNFLNFVAVPITIGVGADYAINMVKRFQLEPGTAADHVVRSTGGAIVLCSITTTIGYAALLMAQNMALNSFGEVAMIGEVTCVSVAILALPAARLLAERRRVERRAPAPENGVSTRSLDEG